MAKRTVADNIRIQVNNLREEVRNQNTSTLVKDINKKSISPVERNSRLLQASLAMQRAQTDQNYRPSETHIKDFAAAIEIIAEKRGIKPADNGKFSEEQLANDLAPKEMVKIFAEETTRQTYNDGKKAKKEPTVIANEASEALQKDINVIYPAENDQSTAPQEISSIKNIASTFKTDEEVMSLDETERNEYLSGVSDYEKDRLLKMIAENAEKQSKNNEKNVGEVEERMEDPDWGHKKDDDDFKIEQGDIIEYLMKDVILASAAWVGNRAAGFAGVVVYESGAAFCRRAKPWFKAKWESAKSWFKSDDEQQTPDNNNEESSENPFEKIKQAYERNKAILEKNIQIQDDAIDYENKLPIEKRKAIEEQNKLFEQLITRTAVLGEEGVIYSKSENDPNTSPYEKKYTEFREQCSNPEEYKQGLKTFQENIEKYQLQFMIKQLGAENDTEKQKEIKVWFSEYNKQLDKGVRTNQRPQAINPVEYVEAFEASQKQALMRFKFIHHERKLESQMGAFANHYGFFKYLEEYRKNPENEIFKDEEKATLFMEQQQNEGKLIFLTAEKARREGKTDINGSPLLSREDLLKEAENLANRSQIALSQRSTEAVEDTLFQKIIDPNTSAEDRNKKSSELLSEANLSDGEERYAAEMFNLDMELKSNRAKEQEVTERRHAVNRVKRSIEQSHLNQGPLNQTYISRGGQAK